MIDGSIRAQAEAFKAAARDRLSAYPALVPDSDWPSMSILDDLSYHLSYRSDWTDQEERLFQGVISLLAQFVHESWSTFHDDVAVTRTLRSTGPTSSGRQPATTATTAAVVRLRGSRPSRAPAGVSWGPTSS